MIHRLATLCCVALFGLGLGSARADALPGRFLITNNGTIYLFDPSAGTRRAVAERGSEPAFLPSGKGFAYIREGGCHRVGDYCYTKYSVFIKSFAERDPDRLGRQIFRWGRFFVRTIDVSPGGRLIFSASSGPRPRAHGKTVEIYSAALNGSNVRRLTYNRVQDNDSKVSPDGRSIAFSRKVNGRGQIFRMGIDGSGLERLTRDRRRNRLPSWAPDGRRITFISQPAGHDSFRYREIYAISAHGGRKRRLTHDQGIENDPVYSPDGRSIAYIVLGDLWVMRSDGTSPRRLLGPPGPPGFELGLDWGRDP